MWLQIIWLLSIQGLVNHLNANIDTSNMFSLSKVEVGYRISILELRVGKVASCFSRSSETPIETMPYFQKSYLSSGKLRTLI